MWDIELTPIMGGDVLAGTKATVRSTDFVRVLTGETALATLIRHAVLHHHKLRPAEVLAASSKSVISEVDIRYLITSTCEAATR
jgi:hypothetical protein